VVEALIDPDQILSMIRMQGPSIPVQISKKIGQNILFSSAILGELASKGKLKISNVKVGGTPLYYLPGQEHMLQQYSKYLNEKEQRVYEKLRSEKLLRDKDEEPVYRVALRNMKDFAIGLEVSHDNGTEIFWRWYLLKKEEAEDMIMKIMNPTRPPVVEEKKEEPVEKKAEARPAPRPAKKEEPKQEVLVEIDKSDSFAEQVQDYFKEKKIEIIEHKMVRKGSDLEFIVSIPSPVGKLKYFVKARSKKNSNDGDLSSAFLQGQRKNLPVIYLTSGTVTKKGKETAKKEFPSMLIEEM
jgi:hypothetical protein